MFLYALHIYMGTICSHDKSFALMLASTFRSLMAKKLFEIGVRLPMWRGNTKCYTRNHLTPWHAFVKIQLHLPRDLLSIQPRNDILTARFPIFYLPLISTSNTKQRACQQTQSSRPMECICQNTIAYTW